MAQTQLSNLAGMFASSTFGDIINAKFTEKLELMNSLAQEGAVQPANMGGQILNQPYYDFPTDDDEVITANTNVTINPITGFVSSAPWLERQIGFGAEDIINTVVRNGMTPQESIAQRIADKGASMVHKAMMNTVVGCFGAANMTTHIYDLDNANTISHTGVMDAKTLIGDNSSELEYIVMNSKVFNDASKSFATTYDTLDKQGFKTGAITTFAGLIPKQTDLLIAVNNIYPSFIGKKGSVQYKFRPRVSANLTNANKFQSGNFEIELARDAKLGGGTDMIIIRYSVCILVEGLKWNVATTSPTNAVLATGANWTKSATDGKLIKLIAYGSK